MALTTLLSRSKVWSRRRSKSRRDFEFVDGPGVDDDDRPEAVLSPPVAVGAEVELVASGLGVVVPVSIALKDHQIL